MNKELAMRLCDDEERARAVVVLETLLERSVRSGLKLCRQVPVSPVLVPEIIGDQVTPIIWRMLQLIDPEAGANVRKLDERVVWFAYWYTQSCPQAVKMSFLKLLIELNKNPSIASIYA